MNWDVSIGRCKQIYGRYLQRTGSQFGNRKLVLEGERAEYAGRLQIRYGSLKHQALWNLTPTRTGGDASNRQELGKAKKSMSV